MQCKFLTQFQIIKKGNKKTNDWPKQWKKKTIEQKADVLNRNQIPSWKN